MWLRLFTILAAVSLALAAAMAALWVRSVRMGDDVRFCYFTAYPDCDLVHHFWVTSASGGFSVIEGIDHFVIGEGVKLRGWSYDSFIRPTYPFFGMRSILPGWRRPGVWQRAGFEVSNEGTGTPPSWRRGVIVPDWFCILALLLLPSSWWRWGRRALRRRRRLADGCCPRCGYDLRGSPGRCSECGG